MCIWTKPIFQVAGSFPVCGWLRCSRQRQSFHVQQGIDMSLLKNPLKNQPVEPHAVQSLHRARLSAVNQGGKIQAQGIIMQDAGVLSRWGLFVFTWMHPTKPPPHFCELCSNKCGCVLLLFHVETNICSAVLSVGFLLCRKISHQRQIQDSPESFFWQQE